MQSRKSGSSLQRAQGEAHVRVAGPDHRLQRLFQEGCAKLRLLAQPTHKAEVVAINTAGGLTGGDRLAWRAEAHAGACLTLTTPAYEKIYRARADEARVEVALEVGAGARIDWLPQETLLFDGAALARSVEADVAPDGVLLAVDAVLLGRTARGEDVAQGRLHDRWRVRRGGTLLFADDTRWEDDVRRQSRRAAALDGARAYAGVLLVAPDAEARLEALRAAFDGAARVVGGASAFDGRLYGRIVAQDGLDLRRALVRALHGLRDGGPPRLWTL